MDDFLKKVVGGNGVSPSDVCLHAFNENFANAINVEWSKRGSCYEAIFYKNGLEHIAVFDLLGNLMEYRLNLPADFLPTAIRNIVASKGEIMNSVLKNWGNMLEYEVIVRDKDLNRYLITFSDIGSIIDERKL